MAEISSLLAGNPLAVALLDAARHGAVEILRLRNAGLIQVEVKKYAEDGITPIDYVTNADTAAEATISARLAQLRPDDGFIGEERTNDRAGTSGDETLCDPLDGTGNFVESRNPPADLMPNRYGNTNDWGVSLAARRQSPDGDYEYVAAAIIKPETGGFVVGGPMGVFIGTLDPLDPASEPFTVQQVTIAPVAQMTDLIVATNISRKTATKADGLRKARKQTDILSTYTKDFDPAVDTGSSAANTMNLFIPGRGADALWLRVQGDHDRAAMLALVPGAGGSIATIDEGKYLSYVGGPAGATEKLAAVIQEEIRPTTGSATPTPTSPSAAPSTSQPIEGTTPKHA